MLTMKYRSFPETLWNNIEKILDLELAVDSQPVAAFDADGTLWDTDLGENFFKWQIRQKVLKNLPSDPWKHYRDWKESGDPRPAYLWLAQVNQGHSIQEISDWAEQAVKDIEPLPIFDDQKKLIDLFQSKGVRVYIVTASVKWAVEPGALRLGLSKDQVLGVSTKIENGIIGIEQSGAMTYRPGKVEALLQATGGKNPFFSSGNSPGDSYLLAAATRLSLVVGAAKPGHELFSSEEKLRQEALQKKWSIHSF